ncbi:type II toxin-antitoxin system HicB family antitoxin (plasmid) [Embleya sp. NBC_00888]|uniref:type II toxin-antitoxin system HicB family antitoxin n=1 Tax=Embleya sp. NBC_00888 TaxID=2975960 RepID=UPI002F90FE4C|nr:type II toxin-antitoxin system HicB family antitoxin [Embleya sp. NBC_00888]
MTPTVYQATAERSGVWWAVSVEDAAGGVYTQGRTLAEAADMAQDAVAAALDVSPDEVRVELSVAGTTEALHTLDQARRAAEEADRTASRALADAVATLLDTGMSQRDAGRVLGLSHQRVSQLAPRRTTTQRPGRGKLQDA